MCDGKSKQYTTLNDAANTHALGDLAGGDTEIWYAKNPTFDADATGPNFRQTHILLGKVKSQDRDLVFHQLQGEVWSPRGEANNLIRGKGLKHTSMSVGDALVINGVVHVCTDMGWNQLGETTGICTTGKLHEPDWDSVTPTWDHGRLFLDVSCKHCGRSGCVGTSLTLQSGIDW